MFMTNMINLPAVVGVLGRDGHISYFTSEIV